MNKFRSHLLAGAGLVALAVIGSEMSLHRAAATSGPGVTISGPLPLPIAGSTTVSGTVAATQSGAPWSVNVANTPTVSITGTPSVSVNSVPPVSLAVGTSVRDTDNPARQPFQASVILNFATTDTVATNTLEVPTGKELVIEYVSMFADLPTGNTLLELVVSTFQGASSIEHYFSPRLQGTQGMIDIYLISQQTRLYADPGLAKVSFVAIRTASNSTGQVGATVSGYLVGVP